MFSLPAFSTDPDNNNIKIECSDGSDSCCEQENSSQEKDCCSSCYYQVISPFEIDLDLPISSNEAIVEDYTDNYHCEYFFNYSHLILHPPQQV